MSTRKAHITLSAGQTRSLAGTLAKAILRKRKKNSGQKAVVICLDGELGAGKTVFVQGLAKGLGIEKRITSPTFVLMKKFPLPGSVFGNFYHIDCYRLEEPEDILKIGFEKIASRPENIICLEWAGKVKKILPKSAVWLRFENKGGNKRRIVF